MSHLLDNFKNIKYLFIIKKYLKNNKNIREIFDFLILLLI